MGLRACWGHIDAAGILALPLAHEGPQIGHLSLETLVFLSGKWEAPTRDCDAASQRELNAPSLELPLSPGGLYQSTYDNRPQMLTEHILLSSLCLPIEGCILRTDTSRPVPQGSELGGMDWGEGEGEVKGYPSVYRGKEDF